MLGDGCNTAAAKAVTLLMGSRNAVFYQDIAGIGVLNFDQKLVQANTAKQLDPS